jgi:hypothetical protein
MRIPSISRTGEGAAACRIVVNFPPQSIFLRDALAGIVAAVMIAEI